MLSATVLTLGLIPSVFSFSVESWVNSAYGLTFSLLMFAVELRPIFCCARPIKRIKRRVTFWCKFLSRLQGRGLMYILIGGCQLAQYTFFTFISGGVMVVAGVCCVIVACYAKSKLNRLHRALVANHDTDIGKMRSAFTQFDKDQSGALDPIELALLAEKLGSEMSKDQLYAIFCLLDINKDGKIEFDEFCKWWVGDSEVDYSMV